MPHGGRQGGGTMNLEGLPVERGFRLRGASMTRLETFADAAFAFAVTLLVISVDDVPSSYREFQTALQSVPAFFACFAQLVMFWIGHRRWSRCYGLDDSVSLWLTMLLIAGVLVLVYPLRVVFSLGMGALSGGWLPIAFPMRPEDTASTFVFYGLAFASLSGVILALYIRAWRLREALRLNAVERVDTRTSMNFWTILCATGLTSSLIALSVPPAMVGLAGWFYFWLFFGLGGFLWRTGRRRRQALLNRV